MTTQGLLLPLAGQGYHMEFTNEFTQGISSGPLGRRPFRKHYLKQFFSYFRMVSSSSCSGWAQSRWWSGWPIVNSGATQLSKMQLNSRPKFTAQWGSFQERRWSCPWLTQSGPQRSPTELILVTQAAPRLLLLWCPTHEENWSLGRTNQEGSGTWESGFV